MSYPKSCEGCCYYHFKRCHTLMQTPETCPCRDCLIKVNCSVRCEEFKKRVKEMTEMMERMNNEQI